MKKPELRVIIGFAFILMVVFVTSITALIGQSRLKTESMSSSAPPDFYSQNVQPIFNQRCVACHSCNIAPCQLNLTAYEGVTRGATKELLYNPSRKTSIPPSRFAVDAKTTEQWRGRNFFDVLPAANQTPMDSILLPLIKLRQEHASLRPKLRVEESHTCPGTRDEVTAFLQAHVDSGMPYGLPPLSAQQSQVIETWLGMGAPGPTQTLLHVPEVFRFVESYLNNQDPKSQLVARYLYEHLFLAHLHLEDSPHSRFFRLVRSSTDCSQSSTEFPTRRPWDAPGKGQFWYCIEPINQTIVDKSHVVYELGPKKLARWKELFDSSEWSVQHPPSRDDASASNPFATFQDIPAKARYQWLLDDAQYTVMTFIKGPVCRGQEAVNVINEQFYVMFMDPKTDFFVNDPAYAASTFPYLRLPAEKGSDHKLSATSLAHVITVLNVRNKYRQLRDLKMTQDHPNGYSVADIWDGDKTNPNALLTVLRHYDSAQVLRGAVGEIPKTAFVLDYPLMERIVYDLVVGFDVFGNFTHQVDTREYMSLIRAEAEENYLNFLPAPVRRPLRDFFNRGKLIQGSLMVFQETKMFAHNPLHPVAIQYDGDFKNANSQATWFNAKNQFMNALYATRFAGPVRGRADAFNAAQSQPLSPIPANITSVQEFETQLAKLTGHEAKEKPYPQFTDDAALLRVVIDESHDRVYTLIRNREHRNMVFASFENNYRKTDEDSLIASPGIITSYPNRYFVVSLKDSGAFLNSLEALSSQAEQSAFLDRYSISRQSPDFWKHNDWFQNFFLTADPINNGILDLSRYGSAEEEDLK